MKIRCFIERKKGSSQTIGGVVYRWNEDNGHVCEVDNPEHAALLLAHPEGWRLAEEAESTQSVMQTIMRAASDHAAEQAVGKPSAKRGRKPSALVVAAAK